MRLTLNRSLALAAGVLAVGALFAGDRSHSPAADDPLHISTAQLAGWIKEHKQGLRVIDLRTESEFEAYHIPSAQIFSADAIAPGDTPPTIVVYSDTGSASEATLARGLLPAGSAGTVLVLRGGVNAWLNDIMLPRLPANPTDEQRQRYAEQRELSRYFGGRPSSIDTDTSRPSTAAAVRKLKRMGC